MGKKMFDYVIGNPPYQEDTENKGDRPNPIYHLFMDATYQLADKVELIHPARFLFNAGQTPKSWNEKMLKDVHFKVLSYEQRSEKLFPSTDIKGGVAISYHDADKDFGAIGVFTSFEELNSITKKVNAISENSIENLVSARGVYRFSEKFFSDYPFATERLGKGTGNMVVSNAFTQIPEAFLEQEENDDTIYVKLLGRIKGKRVFRYLAKKYLLDNNYIDAWKVMLPEANGSGAIGEVLSTPLIGAPLIGATDTFISIGSFENEVEADNTYKYIKTKFARTMLGVKKITQHNPRATWKYVPLQDFTNHSDIDWSQSIHDIDLQLYRKYGLDEKEIDFIETHVKEMA
ncbi:MAG: Eco57I restriction-modification methylase domain-containing protein [Selenomonadaceae bacterium]|nr:Eco57I restriction-modification methylase domain-containing protein [Selenomonadaceae bacterium]